MLAGCVTSGNNVLKRDLPNLPPYVREVMVKNPQATDDALEVAVRERVGRVKANSIIKRAKRWYFCVQKSYAEGNPDHGCR
jgi:hypothetical protein